MISTWSATESVSTILLVFTTVLGAYRPGVGAVVFGKWSLFSCDVHSVKKQVKLEEK